MMLEDRLLEQLTEGSKQEQALYVIPLVLMSEGE